MYYLKAEASFDAAHFLAHYQGKCHNIHGHHWIVEMRISGTQLQTSAQEDVMLVDFSQLKHDLKQIADEMDHTLIYETGTLRDATRTALEEDGFSLTDVLSGCFAAPSPSRPVDLELRSDRGPLSVFAILGFG